MNDFEVLARTIKSEANKAWKLYQGDEKRIEELRERLESEVPARTPAPGDKPKTETQAELESILRHWDNEFDPASDEWVNAKEAARIGAVTTDDLKDARRKGNCQAEIDNRRSVIDQNGRVICRPADKPHAHPQYLKAYLVSEQKRPTIA